jgi:DNA-binding GntR family transcriptional regulator
MNRDTCLEPSGRTRRGWVFNRILSSIFAGEFRGGDRLVEQELATTIGVSRTPIREAFSELAAIGLITLKPNQGAIVRPLGPQQIREMYQIRWLLECEAARLAAGRADLPTFRLVRETTQQWLDLPRSAAWTAEAIALDQQFHELVAASCGSPRLAEEIGRYRGLVQAIRTAVGNISQAQEIAIVEHTQIIDAIIARDGDRAAAAMREHIERGTEAAVQALFDVPRPRV